MPPPARGPSPTAVSSQNSDRVLSIYQLRRLARHQYRVEGQSLLDPYLNNFYRWVVEQIPLWWAPNALTLAGLVINGLATFILMMFCVDAKGQAPGWCYYLCACGLFAYQVLDAIDGKQARRTNSSSPLGELFDHGCDALTIVFVVIGVCMMVELGYTPWLLFSECFATMFVFYTAHWQTYCSGTLQINSFDVTEAMLVIIFMHILTGLCGTAVWHAEILSTGMPLKVIPALISFIVGIFACFNYFRVIILRGGIGKNGSTVAGTSVLSPVFPIGFLILFAYWFWQNSTTAIFEHHPVLFVMAYGMSASKLSNKLVISYMSCSEMELWDSSFYGPLLILANQYFSIIDDYPALWFCFIFCTFDLVSYFVKICLCICEYLNINCFTVKPLLTPNVSSSGLTAGSTDRANCRQLDQSRCKDMSGRGHNGTQTMSCFSSTSYANPIRFQRIS